MSSSDFLNLNLPDQCLSLAGEINKVYQHLPWAVKNAAVARLKRQVNELAQSVQKAHDAKSVLTTQKHLQNAVALTHECVPLMSLCVRKALLSQDLNDRWIKRLNAIEKQLNEWLKAG